jgi:hypothetical protein
VTTCHLIMQQTRQSESWDGMTSYYPQLAERVRSQRDNQPVLYGEIDFDTLPYRHTTDPQVPSALPAWVADRVPILQDERVVELISVATMLGDVVADPYASLVERHGVPRLIGMLRQACREGVDTVADAPEELRAFIAAMEATPDWLDMRLVEQGARRARIPAAFIGPFVTRGAFLATFVNTYAALPMALTGALSGRRAARRVNETAGFFAITTLPGALNRRGPGFEAAAMVRLMHSMVRYNALKRSGKWDARVYGIPVPQVDQMPAGLINMYLLAVAVLRRGRTEFGASERALLEFSRYRCFLLGLPEELLPTSPAEIVYLFHARGAMLRDGFDDAVCGELVRSTMSAYLRPGRSWFDRAADSVERSWSKIAFVAAYCGRNREAAAAMSVTYDAADIARVAVTAPFIAGRFLTGLTASRVPAVAPVCDAYTTRVVRRRLANYGTPGFDDHSHTHRPAQLRRRRRGRGRRRGRQARRGGDPAGAGHAVRTARRPAGPAGARFSVVTPAGSHAG